MLIAESKGKGELVLDRLSKFYLVAENWVIGLIVLSQSIGEGATATRSERPWREGMTSASYLPPANMEKGKLQKRTIGVNDVVLCLSQPSAAVDPLHQPTAVDPLHQPTAVDLLLRVNTHHRLYMLFIHCKLLLDGDTTPPRFSFQGSRGEVAGVKRRSSRTSATDNWKTLQELEKAAQIYWNAKDRKPPRNFEHRRNWSNTQNFHKHLSAIMAFQQLMRRALRSRPDQILSTSSAARAFSSAPITATLFPGDGIGPEIAESVKQVFREAEVPIQWEEHYVGTEIDPRTQSFLTWESLESVRRNRVGLKGPMATPIGKGHRSLNLTLRKELNLYANVRPCYSLPGYKTKYDDVNLITIRENTEGEYSGLEHQVVRGVVESLKIITRQASLRVAEYAFHYAKAHGRERVSAIHKATIMQKTDGLFLQCCREVAQKYPEIKYEEVVIDNCCMMLVKNPALFDVLVMPNLYGDIISDLCAGLIGGLGLTPSCNIGEGGIALAEAVHGSAPDIAGKNLANPTALLLSGVSMLRHLELHDKADRIQKAVLDTIAEGKFRTADLGGSSKTSDFTKAICDHL
ncbi:Isocitrate dehydrogenase [NAD] catalytic subunit 5, mitochondrial [Linum perenne]